MLDIHISQLSDAFGYGIWVIDKDEQTRIVKVLRLGEIKWEEHDVGHRLPKPTFETSTREGNLIFEKFIERLKEAGYGRDKVSVESGELKAMREHLTDMKKLVFTPPPHFISSVLKFGDTPSGLSMLGRVTPGRVWYSDPTSDVLTIKKDRVIEAAGNCAQTKIVLKTLFPEAFE